MKLPKITEPITSNEERALRENRRPVVPSDEGFGGPSRAHPHKPKQRHSKKPGGTVSRRGGRTRT